MPITSSPTKCVSTVADKFDTPKTIFPDESNDTFNFGLIRFILSTICRTTRIDGITTLI